MSALLLKDFYSLRPYFKSFGIMYLIFIVCFLKTPEVLSSVMAVMSPMAVINTMSYDDYYHWNRYAKALPMGSRTIVKSKYILLVLLSAAMSAVAGVVGSVMSIVQNMAAEKLPVIWGGALGSVGIAILLYSFVLPLLYKFGVEKGRFIMIGLIGVLTASIYLLLSLNDKLTGFIPSEGQLKLLLYMSPLIILLIVWASYQISCKIFEKQGAD